MFGYQLINKRNGAHGMQIKFYGTRGSTPVCDPGFFKYGGNTTCVLITFSTGAIAILDAGSGIRKLGNDLIARGHEQFEEIIIGFSHTHWDHIQGFPFFKPAYDPRRTFTMAICGIDRTGVDLRRVFETQMNASFFPVPLENLGATFNFQQLELSGYTHPSGITVDASRHNHPGGAFGYRIREGDTTVVYCTDVEHGDAINPNVVALAHDADLLIHDAQYTPEELPAKRYWGHSTWEQAVEVAEQAGVKRLALTHHDPEHDDAFIEKMEKECLERFPNAFFAREGIPIDI
jgi:phosphoribosyl 1,2-cyclic phosphodiesterase